MKIKLIAIGTKMPDWVRVGFKDYQRRIHSPFSLNLIEKPLIKRHKSQHLATIIESESEQLIDAVSPGDAIIALDRLGRSHSTHAIAQQLSQFQQIGQHISILIGGPEGLSKSVLAQATQRWSLSALTLAHPLVRIVIAEQLYRAICILNRHPYHRDRQT